MTLAWLQLSYRQTEAYSFSTETAVAFITAKIVASLRDTACCHRNRRFQLQKAVTFYLCARTVYFSAIGTKAFCACAALESLLWFVTFWPKRKGPAKWEPSETVRDSRGQLIKMRLRPNYKYSKHARTDKLKLSGNSSATLAWQLG
jgi:hypothetical protein